SNVIPFQSYAAPQADRPQKTMASPTSASDNRRLATRPPDTQTDLPFLPAAPLKPRTLRTTVDAVIYCEEPVAPGAHRAVAGALDWAMVLIGYALFLVVFRIAGGPVQLTRTNTAIFLGMLALIGLAYGLMWTIVGAETAGMRWTHLRVTTFEGQ